MTIFRKKSSIPVYLEIQIVRKIVNSNQSTVVLYLRYVIYLLSSYSWKPVAIGFVVLLTMAIFTFTFFGAVEFEDGRKLMPIFWSSWMPEPFTLIKFENVPPHVW